MRCSRYRRSLCFRAQGCCEVGGAEEIRTPDLRRAKAALSQLSYGPSPGIELSVCHGHARSGNLLAGGEARQWLVGHSGLEPETSVLSGLRSNQLSYTPDSNNFSP